MEINKEVTVKLTTKDLKEIIIEHLKSKGVDVKSVYFEIKGSNDWLSQYKLGYALGEVVCKGVDI